MNKGIWSTVGLCIVLLLAAGCSWEGGDQGNTDDGGNTLNYPPPPYGADFGDTAQDFRVEEVLCSGATPQGTKALYAHDFLSAKALMVSVHAGWCSICKAQAETMEQDLWDPYKDQGLEIVMVIFQDDAGNGDKESLKKYGCYYKNNYSMHFHVAIDPDTAAMGQFFRPTATGTPLNMLLDPRMEIRFKMEGIIPDSNIFQGNIEGLLSE
jgi:hypothetical protein